MKPGDACWVRDTDGTWCLCRYWKRAEDGDKFYVIAEIKHKITLRPDSPWTKELDAAEAADLERIVGRRRAIAEEDDNLFLELSNMSFKKD